MAVHIEIQTIITETNKHELLSELKSVAWYQKYVHIKACLGRPILPSLRDIILLVYLPSRQKDANIGDQEYQG